MPVTAKRCYGVCRVLVKVENVICYRMPQVLSKDFGILSMLGSVRFREAAGAAAGFVC